MNTQIAPATGTKVVPSIFELAVKLGAQRALLRVSEDALMYISTKTEELRKTDDSKKTQWLTYREHLRMHLLTATLLQDAPSEYSAEFNGYGDSGELDYSDELPLLKAFFNYILHHHVTFDWYNNEGGGGDITWKLHDDVAVVNGYRNTTVAESIMDAVEF